MCCCVFKYEKNNVGEFPLTKAIVAVRVVKIRLVGEDGVGGSDDDVIIKSPTPEEASKYLLLLNRKGAFYSSFSESFNIEIKKNRIFI